MADLLSYLYCSYLCSNGHVWQCRVGKIFIDIYIYIPILFVYFVYHCYPYIHHSDFYEIFSITCTILQPIRTTNVPSAAKRNICKSWFFVYSGRSNRSHQITLESQTPVDAYAKITCNLRVCDVIMMTLKNNVQLQIRSNPTLLLPEWTNGWLVGRSLERLGASYKRKPSFSACSMQGSPQF